MSIIFNKKRESGYHKKICAKKRNFRIDEKQPLRQVKYLTCRCVKSARVHRATTEKFDLVLQQHYGALCSLLLHHSPVRRITQQLTAHREREREREGCAPSKLFSFFRRNARRLPNIRRRSWRAQKINIVSNEAKNSYLLSFSHTQRERANVCVSFSLSPISAVAFSLSHTRAPRRYYWSFSWRLTSESSSPRVWTIISERRRRV